MSILWFTSQAGFYGRVDPATGEVDVYDPADGRWQQWKLPGDNPQPYAVYVDIHNMVWLSDFQANSFTRFDLANKQFTVYTLPNANTLVRQILGRPGEVLGAESDTDMLVVLRTGP